MQYKEIISIEKVFESSNLEANIKPDISVWPERDRVHKTHEFYVHTAIDAINEGWIPNWNNTSERKWVIIWQIVPNTSRASGRGLSIDGVFCDDVYTFVGPRLCFRSEAQARHFAKYFLALMESYYLGD